MLAHPAVIDGFGGLKHAGKSVRRDVSFPCIEKRADPVETRIQLRGDPRNRGVRQLADDVDQADFILSSPASQHPFSKVAIIAKIVNM
jgi:hypothetical protein